jgi:hypothetical protein
VQLQQEKQAVGDELQIALDKAGNDNSNAICL